jgi:hypothetical protein
MSLLRPINCKQVRTSCSSKEYMGAYGLMMELLHLRDAVGLPYVYSGQLVVKASQSEEVRGCQKHAIQTKMTSCLNVWRRGRLKT